MFYPAGPLRRWWKIWSIQIKGEIAACLAQQVLPLRYFFLNFTACMLWRKPLMQKLFCEIYYFSFPFQVIFSGSAAQAASSPRLKKKWVPSFFFLYSPLKRIRCHPHTEKQSAPACFCFSHSCKSLGVPEDSWQHTDSEGRRFFLMASYVKTAPVLGGFFVVFF